MARTTYLDVSVGTIAGGDFRAYGSAKLGVQNTTVDGRGADDDSVKKCIVGRDATLALDLMSNDSGGNCRVTDLNVSAFALGGTAYLADLMSLSLSARHALKSTTPRGTLAATYVYLSRDVSATADVFVDTATGSALREAVASATLSDSNMTFFVTIDGVTVALPMVIESAEALFAKDEVQVWRLSFGMRGDFTSPAGTATLLAKAINAPGTALALVLTDKASGGVSWTGNFLLESWGFSVTERGIVTNTYGYKCTGGLTATATP